MKENIATALLAVSFLIGATAINGGSLLAVLASIIGMLSSLTIGGWIAEAFGGNYE